jgi:hypothetical protein
LATHLSSAADDAQMMQEQMQSPMGASPADVNKIYQSERENLELIKHEWELENVERKLLGVAPVLAADRENRNLSPKAALIAAKKRQKVQ